MLLLGALVGYSAYGGFGNNAITNWYRDKGYGMGSKVGFIPAAIGGKTIHVSLGRLHAEADAREPQELQGLDEAAQHRPVGRLLGRRHAGHAAPRASCTSRCCPRAWTCLSWGIAVSPASGITKYLGPAGFYLMIFFGFWILFSTAISNVDLVVRQATDMLWFASDKVHKWSKDDIRRVYYVLMIASIGLGGAVREHRPAAGHPGHQRQRSQLYHGALRHPDHDRQPQVPAARNTAAHRGAR